MRRSQDRRETSARQSAREGQHASGHGSIYQKMNIRLARKSSLLRGVHNGVARANVEGDHYHEHKSDDNCEESGVSRKLMCSAWQ
mmetsp:Transcript_1643/g.3578  ORF Transcript_1643/g.3578 Transcript_1643/m.3578 type:complete len:85 (-) Transcript_1643:106-360(-)